MSFTALNKLSEECWKVYDELSSTSMKDALRTPEMPEAMPVLFFGDYKRYFSSKIKVITVAINPSKNEFPGSDPFKRFSAMRGIERNHEHFTQRYLESLENYFYTNPFMQWFNQYNHVLSGMNCGYANQGENVALHTDLYSPFPTDPVWGGLRKEQRELLIEKGIQLWKELVEILEPDIILMSTAENMTGKLGFEFLGEWEEIYSVPEKANGDLRAQPYVLKKGTLKLTNNKEAQLFFGKAGVTPFQYLSNEKKREAGRVILSSYQRNSQSTFVQFIHPGGEHKPRRGESIFPWNEKDHKRKFIKNPGKYITNLNDSDIKSADLTFWGEWEAQSKVLEELDRGKGPNYLHQPFYEKPSNYTGKQNTDPFIFGDHFYYTCCRQYKRVANGKLKATQLTKLQLGSLILFGSKVKDQFVLDTVFVADHNPIQHNADNIDEMAEGLPQTYVDATIAALYPEKFSVLDVTATVDTEKSCLVSFESQDEDEFSPEIEEEKLTFYLYKGITYENRQKANGMFSFFPCRPYSENAGFKRPTIKINQFVTQNLMMGYKASLVDQAMVNELWESVVAQVLEQGLVLGLQTDFPQQEGDETVSSTVENIIVPSSNEFVNAYKRFDEREEIVSSFESYSFYQGQKEYWFVPASFKDMLPLLKPVYLTRTTPWKSCYAFSYFFYKNQRKDRLGLKLELGPFTPENRSRSELLNFLHREDKSRDNLFTITPGALEKTDGQYSKLVKAEVEISSWDDSDEILNKMNILLDHIDFSRLNQYLIQLYNKFVQTQ